MFTARKRKLLLVSKLACLLLRSTRYCHQWHTLWAISNTCMSVCHGEERVTKLQKLVQVRFLLWNVLVGQYTRATNASTYGVLYLRLCRETDPIRPYGEIP